jgi:hypothetical protein
MAYKMDKYLISRLNVVNSEFCENGVTCKIPHGDFEKLAGMSLISVNGGFTATKLGLC